MKKRIKKILTLTITFFVMLFPSKMVVNAAIVQTGAIINDGKSSNNLNVIIIGMLVVIVILVGSILFSNKK